MKNRIFIFEFVSGGGFNKIEIPNSFFSEGFGMLRSIISDFKLLEFEITTLLDYRFLHLVPLLNADMVEVLEKEEEYLLKFEYLVKQSESCFIIAPEFSKTLYRLTKIVKKNKKNLLSIDLKGVNLGTSKLDTFKFFRSSKVKTPQTFLLPRGKQNFDANFVIEKFKNLNCPVIIKPEDGVGADSIFYFESEEEIIEFFNDPIEKLDSIGNYILQEYVEGKDLSVSLLGTENSTPKILSVNTQDIDIKKPNFESNYFGGHTPVENYSEIEASLKENFKKMDLSRFKGYFGIDFIRNENCEIYFIEINPRLTTSYLGLRNIINQNLAKMILSSKQNGKNKLPEVLLQNHSLFSRIELVHKSPNLNKKIIEELIYETLNLIPEMITPPISLDGTSQFTCFIATKTKDFLSSKKRMQEIIQTLQSLDYLIVKQG
ncbi:hypothetical protein LCGC14_0290900 [marine sediment metagenome]|uniref:ATP-grasp domain-containing protein n=1 Tax=marine sediment metagenome TaxID=412755 RepID=A0A0F9WEL0_9ZZZZ